MSLKVLIPLFFTTGNLVCGSAAIFFALNHHIETAALLLIISALFDGIDGWAARKLGVDGKMGATVDTAADYISFALAPAFIIYRSFDSPIGLVAGAFYLLSILFRLYRYHKLKMPHGVFLGMAAPAAALPVAMTAALYAHGSLPQSGILIITFIFGLLATSTIHYPSWYSPAMRFLPARTMKIFVFCVVVIVLIRPVESILLLHIIYAVIGPILLRRSLTGETEGD